MAYTTPATFSTGQIVTAAQLNEQIRDNMTYVHDVVYTVSQSTTSQTIDTVYQNTTGKIQINSMSVLFQVPAGNAYSIQILCGTTNPPTNLVQYINVLASTDMIYQQFPITFVVAVDNYYECLRGATTSVISLGACTNWTLF
jgi:hypothetical protein